MKNRLAGAQLLGCIEKDGAQAPCLPLVASILEPRSGAGRDATASQRKYDANNPNPVCSLKGMLGCIYLPTLYSVDVVIDTLTA